MMKGMKKIVIAMLSCMVFVAGESKTVSVAGVTVSNIDAARTDNNLFLTMDVDMSSVKLTGNQELIVTPVIYAGNDSVAMQPMTFAGRNRYFNRVRNAGGEDDRFLYHAGEKARVNYRLSIPYERWMSSSDVKFSYDVRSCCGEKVEAPESRHIARLDMEPERYVADFVYIPPKVEAEKYREERGEAFVDFIVNRTNIVPTYRNNEVELGKILRTIDLVRNDKDVTMTGMSIHGYASPEGSWSNNVRLAKGRTESLKQYVCNLYNFDPAIITTNYTPEDWDGLLRRVEGMSINNREGIIDIIKSDMEPDAKNSKIQRTYPVEYSYLLKNVYPALRHSDYVVQYKVRAYYDPKEILEVMRTAPQKLSLAELYAAAQTLEPGSDEFNEVFEVAVRMFPTDTIANLNAANAAMSVGNLKGAENYLRKAGDSEQADYARGVLCALKDDFAGAKAYFEKAKGVPEAAKAIEDLNRIEAERDKIHIIIN